MKVCEPFSFWDSPLPCHPSLTVLSPSPHCCAPAWRVSLSSSPVLVLTLGWCSLRIAAVVGGSVAVVGCAVVIGVLLGVGCSPACRNITSAPKNEIRIKITHEWDREVLPPSPAGDLFFGLPVPVVVAPLGCRSRCRCRLGPVLVVAIVPIVAAPRETLVLSWFPFPFRTRSPFVNNG